MGHLTPQHKQNSCTAVIRSSFQHSEGTKYKHFAIFLRWGMYELGYPLSDHYISIARALRLQTWYSKAPPIYIITTKSYSTCRTIFTQFHEVSNSTKILSIDYLCQELNWLITLMCGEKTNGSSFFLSPGICCKQFFPGLTFWDQNKKVQIALVHFFTCLATIQSTFESIFLIGQKLKLSLGRMYTMNIPLKSAPFSLSIMDFNKIPHYRHVNDFKL